MIRFFRLLAHVRVLSNRVKLLEHQLEAERWRNIVREDFFVSAAVMGGRWMVGIQPRNGPAYQKPQQARQPAYDPFQFRGVHLLEYEAEWKPQAEAAGVSEHEAKRQFALELERRRGNRLIDDPYGTAN